MVLKSEAKLIAMSTDTVRIKPTDGAQGLLDVQGNIAASGNIFSNAITSNSIQTSQLTISEGTFTTDTIHAKKQLTVNNSLNITKEDANNFAEVSTKDTAVALVLQKEEAAQVVIGDTALPSQPVPGQPKDKLTVIGNTLLQGDVNVSGNFKTAGNITANCLNTSCLNVTGQTNFDSLRVANRIKIGNSTYLGTNELGVANNIYTNDGNLLIQSEQENYYTTNHNTIINANNTGNVGIGTLNPITKLHIFEKDNALCGARMRLEYSYTGILDHCSSSIWDIIADGNDGNYLTFSTPSLLTPAMVLSGNGYVGIGVSTPEYTLDVRGHIGLVDHLIFNSTSTAGVINWPASESLWFRTNSIPGDIHSYTTRMIITGDGKVGIGTTSPSTLLHLLKNEDGANLDLVTFDRTTASPADNDSYDIIFKHENDNNEQEAFAQISLIASDVSNGTEGGALAFSTANGVNGSMNESMRILSNGNIALGSNFISYDGTLDGTDGKGIGFNANNDVIIQGTTTSPNNRKLLVYAESYFNETVSIYHDTPPSGYKLCVFGKTYLDGTIGDNYALYVDGDIQATGSITGNSDIMFKENIQSINDGLSIISQLQPKTFNFKISDFPSMNLPHELQYGLIAQDVDSVLPEIVKTRFHPAEYDTLGNLIVDSIEYKTLNYTALIPILIQAIKEQNTIIDSLKLQQKTTDSLQTATINSLLDHQAITDNMLATLQNCCLQGASNNTKQNNGSGQGNTKTTLQIELANNSQPILYQNEPNPFGDNTIIRYFIPENTKGNAFIVFYDMYGKELKKTDVTTKGFGNINANTENLASGIYSYSLIVNERVIDTKKMIKQ